MSSKPFASLVALTASSGVMICDSFGDMQELADHVTGQPTWTHQFASRSFADSLAAEVIRQHPELADVTIKLDGLSDLEGDARAAFIKAEQARLTGILGETLTFTTGNVDHGDSFTEPLTRIGTGRKSS